MKRKIIEIPFFRQKTGYYCGPAVLQMLFKYFGLQKSQKAIAFKVKSNTKRGTSHRNMVRFVRQSGFFVRAQRNSGLKDIIKFIDFGFPAIVNYIEPSDNEGHYALVVGYDPKFLILNDPWNGENFKISKIEFVKRWHNERRTSYNWLMVISENDFKGRKNYD